jgi:uncharacterized protein YjbJ (UPF0337 family)
MTVDVLEGKWQKIQGEVKEQWSKLTDSDLKKIKGRRDKLEGALREKYGYTKQKAREEVDNYLNEFSDHASSAREKLAEGTTKATQMVKERAGEYSHKLEDAVANMPRNPVQLVKENPWLAIVAVVIISAIIGILLRPTNEQRF